jgi:uncharacterized protein (TIRG00374 family)
MSVAGSGHDRAPTVDGGATFGRRQIVGIALTLIVLVIVFAGVLPQLGDYSQAWTAIEGLSAGALLALLLTTVAVVLVYVLPFQAALPGLAYGPAFIVRQTSFTISNAVPAGGAFGLGVQYAMLGTYGVGPSSATAAIGITSVWNTLVTLTLPVVALGLLAITGQTDAAATVVAVLGVVVVGVVVGLLALVLRSEDTASRLGGWGDRVATRAAGLVGREMDIDLAAMLVEFRRSIVDVVAQRWALVTVTNVVQQLAQFAVLWVALVAMRPEAGATTLIEAFAAFALARLGSFIPLTPGGIGTVDAALAALLQAFGTDPDEALAATLVWRAATYVPQVLLGGVTLLIWRRTARARPPA